MDQATYLAVLERVRPKDSSRRWDDIRWGGRQTWQLAGACVLLTLALGTGFLLTRRAQPTTLVAAARPQIDVAYTYIDARNERNADLALSLFAPNAMVGEYPIVREAAELPAAFEYLELVDEQFSNFACDVILEEPEVVVCLYEMSNRLIERVGLESISGNLRFTVDDERIVSMENTIDDAYESTVLVRWFNWLETEFEDGIRSSYRWAVQLDRIVPTPRLDDLAPLVDALDRYTGTG